jgi:hypothetical protein
MAGKVVAELRNSKQYSRQMNQIFQPPSPDFPYTEITCEARMCAMKPKTILCIMVAVCAAVFAFFPASRSTAQSDLDSPAVAALLRDVQTQQTTLAENQKQIDTKLADIGESLRVARIFISRGGKGGTTK